MLGIHFFQVIEGAVFVTEAGVVQEPTAVLSTSSGSAFEVLLQEADSLIALLCVNVGAGKPGVRKMAPRRPPVSFLEYCYRFRVPPLQGKRATGRHVSGHLSRIDSIGLPGLLYCFLVPAHQQQGVGEVLTCYEG